jgi:hypothetical protein
MKKISFFFFTCIIAFSASSQCTLKLDSVWLDSVGSSCNHLFFKYKYSGGTPHSYWWDYGDGNACSCIKPKNVYNHNGTFLVHGKITDINGCSDSFDIMVNVSCSNPCDLSEIGINSFDSLSYSCDEYEFNTITSANAKKIKWDFGDGDTSSSKFIVHTYKNNGTYHVKLDIQDSIGCADTAELTVIVDCPPVKSPCNFVITKIDTLTGQDCKTKLFTLSSNVEAVTIEWRYGDGHTNYTNGSQSSRSYADTGVYQLCAIALDSVGCRDTMCQWVNVYCPEKHVDVRAFGNGNFSFYPNPAGNILTIEALKASTYTIYDMSLKKLKTGDVTVGINYLDIEQLSGGAYLVKMDNDANTVYFKIFKQ